MSICVRLMWGAVFAITLGFRPDTAQAGPYYRLNPHPAELQMGGALDTTRIGAAGGATVALNYRLGHTNESFSFYLGARGHYTVGPISSPDAIGESYHVGGFLVAKTQFQVDSQQNLYPYTFVGPGWIAFDGHPPTSGSGVKEGYGVALTLGTGVVYNIRDRVGFFGEGSAALVFPGEGSVGYFEFVGGLQINFAGGKNLSEFRY